MHRQNWDDLRFILAVADFGSVNKAAEHLGVNHATVLRRVAEFENRNEAAIFERTARGYRVLTDKMDVIDAARAAERAIRMVDEKASGRLIAIEGKTRITTTDTLGQNLLPEVIAQMQLQQKRLSFELLCANAHVDLARLNIDVAVRPASKLGDELVGKVAAELGFAAYASDPRPVGWLGLAGPLSRSVAAQWMANTIKPSDVVGASDSFMILAGMVRAGRAQTVLPCFIGDADPDLVRLPGAMPWQSVPIWVASHASIADTPRVRTVIGLLADIIGKQHARLAGG